MCNMAAYVGSEPAAPILLRLIAAQEGFGGGHFTGLATIHEGRLHLAKVVGDCATLIRETNAADLPGTVGIVHSRTPSAPLQEWAQPFLSWDEQVAYQANGSQGMFKGTVNYDALYDRLLAHGASFRSEVAGEIKPYPFLAHGHSVHVTDLLCGLVADNHTRLGMTLAAAMQATVSEAPSEIASLAISPREPQQVSAVRLGTPLMWGHKPGAGYLATFAAAFAGEGMAGIQPLPAGCTAVLTSVGLQCQPFAGRLGNTCPIRPWSEACRVLDELLSDGEPRHIAAMQKAIMPLWPEGYLNEATMLAYEYARMEMQAGRLEVIHSERPASKPGAMAPQCKFFRPKKETA